MSISGGGESGVGAVASSVNAQMASNGKGRRGLFIVVEGLDRAGKSTQVERLVSRLQSDGAQPSSSSPQDGQAQAAKVYKFPDRTTPIGKMIDAYLRSESEIDDHAIHLLFSANRWELA